MTDAPKTPEAPPPQAATVSDAPPGNWVDRFAPAATRPFLRLSRADRPIGTWLLLIPCFWGLALAAMDGGFRGYGDMLATSGGPALAAIKGGFSRWDIWLALSCAGGAFLMRGAGCTWNDISDRKFDAQVARTRSRPLPSGQVTVPQAVVWMVVQALIAALLLSSYNTTAIWLGVASLALIAIYPFAKRFTWWPQVFLGLAFNWGALLAFAAHSGTITIAALLLYASGISWTLYYDTIYAHQDREDDALIGLKSTARLFGTDTRRWLWGFIAATVLLMGLAVTLVLSRETNLIAMVLALLGVWAFGWHMSMQMRRLNVDDPTSCLVTFRANRNAGLIPALFLAAAALA